ncbi:MAG: Gfo/Idh/MocA family oxidoreductase [Pirellulaceae bacterium]
MTSLSKSRREFLKNTGRVAAASALVTGVVPQVHAAADDTIQVALIGCGGRGTGAVANALSVPNGRTKLVAMADVFDSRLKSSYENLNRQFANQVDVPAERKFVSFDGYKMAMDCLNPGDVVIMTTPCAFRGLHFAYAIEKGLHVFMEKPLTADGPSSRLMFELGEKSVKKNLKVGVGLMCRHCKARQELFERIQSGEIGDITLLRAYRMAGPTGSAAVGPKPENISELMYQIRNFHGFLWASGGAVSDFLIHNIDESCWMKNDWPVQAKANGGRHYRGDHVDQNFDSYSIEYTFGDGTKLLVDGRTIPGCHQEFASYAHGTKGAAVISSRAHTPAKSRIYSGHNFNKQDLTWAFPGPEPNPYQVEWNDLIDAIRNDQPYNEVERGTKASLVTSMGRMAAHTGQLVTYDEIFNHEHEFAPNLDKLTLTAAAPVPAGDTGQYPIPLPGINANREY